MTGIKRIKCGNGNCFIVHNGKNAILIDTGRKKYRDKILKECENKNIIMILLTHGHVDHVSNAAYLSEKWKVPIAMHKEDVRLIKDNLAEAMSAHTVMGKLVLKSIERSFKEEKIEEFEPAIFVQNNDDFNKYGIDAKIIELPGHTEGSIGVMVGEEDFIVGDALMNLTGPRLSMLYGDFSNVRKSAEQIGNSKAKRIHFGHGKSLGNKKWI